MQGENVLLGPAMGDIIRGSWGLPLSRGTQSEPEAAADAETIKVTKMARVGKEDFMVLMST